MWRRAHSFPPDGQKDPTLAGLYRRPVAVVTVRALTASDWWTAVDSQTSVMGAYCSSEGDHQ